MFLRRLYISSTRSYVKYSSPVFQRNITRSYSIATQYVRFVSHIRNLSDLFFQSYNRFTLPQVRGELLLKCMPHRPTTVFSVRALSSGTESVEEKPLEVIDLTESATESSSVESMINTISQTDLPLTALHLGSNYTPIGWCLHYLDFLHSAFPWWGSIAIGTLILRLCMFPFAVQSQRTSAKLNEILPEQAILKEKMNQARVVGDSIEFARLSNEFNTLFKRKGVNPLKAMAMPFLQIPAFLTFFLTLRRMANHPVESLKTGGIFWFTDLSIPDPLHALPILTSLTLWLTLEISFRTGTYTEHFRLQTSTFRFRSQSKPNSNHQIRCPCDSLRHPLFRVRFPFSNSNLLVHQQLYISCTSCSNAAATFPRVSQHTTNQSESSQLGSEQKILH